MSGIDFLLARPVETQELHDALAAALEVPKGSLQVVRSIEESSGESPVVAEVLAAKGDFNTHVAIYMDASAGSIGLPEIRRVAHALGTIALVPDATPDPYSMLLVASGSKESRVDLDPDSLDLREEYRLAGDAPGRLP